MNTAVSSVSRLSVTLRAEEWRRREAAHRARVAPLAEDFIRRRARGEKHSVWDFLFTYYFFSPGKLMTWVPAVFDHESLNFKSPASDDEVVTWEWPPITPRIVDAARWIATLCGNILNRPPRFVCHGLHEWAMVYRIPADDVRHQGVPLRMGQGEIAAFVESQSVCCTHYDAFRFFTPEARPLNAHQPTLDARQEMEQAGCLHANMDLYKWTSRLWPWVGSDLAADAFEIAVACRALDMRASPYDIAALGFPPVKIETEEGRAEYRREQQRISEAARPVRERLLSACHVLLEDFGKMANEHAVSHGS